MQKTHANLSFGSAVCRNKSHKILILMFDPAGRRNTTMQLKYLKYGGGEPLKTHNTN